MISPAPSGLTLTVSFSCGAQPALAGLAMGSVTITSDKTKAKVNQGQAILKSLTFVTTISSSWRHIIPRQGFVVNYAYPHLIRGSHFTVPGTVLPKSVRVDSPSS